MIWINSACAVGIRLAAQLVGSTGVLLTVPRVRMHEARAAVSALLGYDPRDRLDIRPDDLASSCIGEWRHYVTEIWCLSYARDEAGADLLAHRSRESGAIYRRFDIDPVAEAPGEVVPGAFAIFMHAVETTLEEVRSRDPGYFDRRALRTTLSAEFALLEADSVAAEILAAASGPSERCRISASVTNQKTLLSDAISEVYEIELVMGVAPSALAAIDRLFESRLKPITFVSSGDPVRRVKSLGASELVRLVSNWRQHYAAFSCAEHARIANFFATATFHSPAGKAPEFHVFGRTGPQIIIVNALAQDFKYWFRLIDRLSQDYRVVTWTQRCLREDGELASGADHLQDLADVASAVAERPVHLLGWCSGPKLCMRYCLAYPDRVASLMFVAGSFRPFADASLDTSYETKLDMVFKLLDRSPNAAEIVRTTLLKAMSETPARQAQMDDLGTDVLGRTHPALLQSVAAPYTSAELTLQYAKQIRDFWSHTIEPDVGGIFTPAFVIGAELDRIASCHRGQRVAKAMPNARYIELPGATHYCMYDRPDDVASLIRGFIEELGTCQSYSPEPRP